MPEPCGRRVASQGWLNQVTASMLPNASRTCALQAPCMRPRQRSALTDTTTPLTAPSSPIWSSRTLRVAEKSW